MKKEEKTSKKPKVLLNEKNLRKGKLAKFDNSAQVEADNKVKLIEVAVEFNKENRETFTVFKDGQPIHISKTLSLVEQRLKKVVDKYSLIEKK